MFIYLYYLFASSISRAFLTLLKHFLTKCTTPKVTSRINVLSYRLQMMLFNSQTGDERRVTHSFQIVMEFSRVCELCVNHF